MHGLRASGGRRKDQQEKKEHPRRSPLGNRSQDRSRCSVLAQSLGSAGWGSLGRAQTRADPPGATAEGLWPPTVSDVTDKWTDHREHWGGLVCSLPWGLGGGKRFSGGGSQSLRGGGDRKKGARIPGRGNSPCTRGTEMGWRLRGSKHEVTECFQGLGLRKGRGS